MEPGGPGGSSYVSPILSIANDPGLQDAILTAGVYRPVTGAPNNWPGIYDGDLFYIDYFHGNLRRLRKSGGTWSPAPPAPGQPTPDDFATGIFYSVDYLVGPDGSLYRLQQWDDDLNPVTGTLRRIRWTGPAGVGGERPQRTLWAVPNPFVRGTTISFRMPRTGTARLGVYDVTGRLVRWLVVSGAAGDARVTWDGTDVRGTVVPVGVYAVRLEGPGVAEVSRLLRLR
jgi:hypothetical protein